MGKPPENIGRTSDAAVINEKPHGLLSRLYEIRGIRILLWSAITCVPTWGVFEYGVRQGIKFEQEAQRSRSAILLEGSDELTREATKFITELQARSKKDPDSLTYADYYKLRELIFKFSGHANLHVEWLGKDTGQSAVKINNMLQILQIAEKELKGKLPDTERRKIDEEKEQKEPMKESRERENIPEMKQKKPAPKTSRGTQIG